jgi:hypothetical protein
MTGQAKRNARKVEKVLSRLFDIKTDDLETRLGGESAKPEDQTLPTGNLRLETLENTRPPSKAQVGRYKKILAEVRSDIDVIDHAVTRLGRNLQQIRDKQLYFCGGYATFKDFCEKEIGKSRVQVYRLIQAYDTITTLMEAGVSEQDLPATERLCREVRKLEPGQQAPVWRAVLKAVKNKGRKPLVRDVQEAAVEIIQSRSTIERQQTELLHSFEGAARKLKVGLAVSLLTPPFKVKLIGVLMHISESVQCMITALRSSNTNEYTEPESEECSHQTNVS